MNGITSDVAAEAYKRLEPGDQRRVLGSAILLEQRTKLSRANSMAVLAAIGAYLVLLGVDHERE